MIKCDNGAVHISGSKSRVLAELASIIKGIYVVMVDECKMTDQEAREEIANAGRLAFMSDDEVIEEIMRMLG